METIRTTVAPHVRMDTRRAKPARHPLELFTDHAVAARLWCVVALIAVAYCAVQPYLIIQAYRTEERVVVLDPSGTFHVTPLMAFEDASKLHEQHALLACLALFQRNPAGFDQSELLEKLFLADSLKQAREAAKRDETEFVQKALHQKVEVLKLSILESRDQSVLVQAEGQLIRTGLLGGQPFAESPAFTARFTFARNPNLAANGRFPLAVWRYDVSY